MPNFRRGREHIAKAQEEAQNRGDREFRPFLQNFYWKDDGDEKYLLILNPIDDIPMAQMLKVWTDEGRSQHVISRTDEAIGEKSDRIEEDWSYQPQDLNVCAAVELEAEYELVKGRQRPVGFAVKTRTFSRRIRDEAGELTEQREDVTTPVVGYIAQSPNNFFNHVSSVDANVAPIESTAACIRRVGSGTDTDYEVELFDRLELDLTNLIDFVDGITYLNDEMDDLLDALEKAETDEDKAIVIGSLLLDKRLDEMASAEYYDEVYNSISEPSKYPKKGKGRKGGKGKEDEPKAERKTRPSQRRARRSEPAAEEPKGEDEPADEAKEAKEKPRPKSRRNGGGGGARSSESKSQVTKDSPVRDRLAELRARREAKAKAAA